MAYLPYIIVIFSLSVERISASPVAPSGNPAVERIPISPAVERIPMNPALHPEIPASASPQDESHSNTKSAHLPLAGPKVPPTAPPIYNMRNAWGFSFGDSHEGPYTHGYTYWSGGKLDRPPAHSYLPPPRNDISAGRSFRQALGGFDTFTSYLQQMANNALDAKSLLLGSMFTYGMTNFGLPESVNTLIPIRRWLGWDTKKKTVTNAIKTNSTTPVKAEDTKKNNSTAPTTAEDTKKSNATATTDEDDGESRHMKSRRKREVALGKADTDLTELAAMVLSAIESGECLQRSICLMGSQIGASSRGRLAFTLVDTLVPAEIQGNQYFVTMKKALKSGAGYCNRFRCRFH